MSRAGTLAPTLARTREDLAGPLAAYRRKGETVALVPTMGSLHEGHLHLVDRARAAADRVLLSIFVNPLQFGPGEDLDRYPRDLEGDLALAGSRGVDLVFAPDEAAVYPDGDPGVRVVPGPGGDRLCGPHRPGHFEGVLTVVARLFGLIRPGIAHFGRKDYQQAILVRRMVRALELGVEIRMEGLIREPDGLALSSRNVNLSPDEREQALGLSRGLFAALRAFDGGERSPDGLLGAFREEVDRHPGLRLQYVEVVEPETLDPVRHLAAGQVVAVAGFAGSTRLIDNVILGEAAPIPENAAPSPGKAAP